MYSLYFQVARRYVRITPLEFAKSQAVSVFQSALLGNLALGACLRKVRDRDRFATHVLTPAFAQDFASEEQVLDAWKRNQDFNIRGRDTVACRTDIEKGKKHGNGVLVVYYHGQKLVWIPFAKEKVSC